MDSQDERQHDLAQTVRMLEERIAALEDKVETLDDELDDFRWRIMRLANSTIPDPRYPYWTWLLTGAVPDETKVKLEYVLVALVERIKGEEPDPEPARKDIEGLPPSILWGSGPPTVDEIYTAIKAATGVKHDSQCVALVRCLHGQRMFRPLCELVLDAVDVVHDA